MSKAVKSTLIVGGALVGIIVLVVGGLQLVSNRLHDNPRATLLFATSARTLHDKLGAEVLDNMTLLADRIAAGASANASEVATGIVKGSLAAGTYRETFSYIQPTTDTLDLYTAIQREASYIATCYAKLNAAWSAFEDGDQALSDSTLAEARTARDKAVSLRQQNSAALDDLIAATEARLRD
jgi:hypothetical protein